MSDKTPASSPKKGTEEYAFLKNYQNEVEVILHTLNDNEYNAAITYLSAPDIKGGSFEKKGIIFPHTGIVLGTFAEKKVALIQTEQGSKSRDDIEKAIKRFPKAMCILGIGVCYAMDDQKYKLGDVLISNKINDFENIKYKADGRIEDRGQAINVIDPLLRVFCKNADKYEPLLVTSERYFKAFPGTLVCSPQLVNNLQEREKRRTAVPTAIGGRRRTFEICLGKQNKGNYNHQRSCRLWGWKEIEGVAVYSSTGRL